MDENNIPKINNSKKISQLKGRDVITYHQDHSWIAIAQYNDKIGSYHNIAMNLSAITSYSIEKSQDLAAYFMDERFNALVEAYSLNDSKPIGYFAGEYDYNQFSYMMAPQMAVTNFVAYASEFAQKQLMWEYYPSVEYNNVKIQYLITEDDEYILTDKGKKIRVD